MAETEQPKWSNMHSNDEMHILANYLDRIPPINILSVLHCIYNRSDVTDELEELCHVFVVVDIVDQRCFIRIYLFRSLHLYLKTKILILLSIQPNLY